MALWSETRRWWGAAVATRSARGCASKGENLRPAGLCRVGMNSIWVVAKFATRAPSEVNWSQVILTKFRWIAGIVAPQEFDCWLVIVRQRQCGCDNDSVMRKSLQAACELRRIAQINRSSLDSAGVEWLTEAAVLLMSFRAIKTSAKEICKGNGLQALLCADFPIVYLIPKPGKKTLCNCIVTEL